MGNYNFPGKHVVSTLFEYVGLKPQEFRVIMYGLDAAGKTTILYKHILGEIVTTIPTIGFNVESFNINNIKITLWDLGLRDKARPLIRHYLANTHALIMVIDSNDRERLDEFKDEMFKVLQCDELQDTVLLVIANKQDLPNAMSVDELKIKLELNTIRTVRAVNIIGTCAITGDGILDCFEWLSTVLTTKGLQEPFVETYNDVKNLRASITIISYLKAINTKLWSMLGYKPIEQHTPSHSVV